MPGQTGIGDGYQTGYDDGTTGAEVAHKEAWGFVHVVNVTVDGGAYNGGATFEIRDGSGAANAVWSLNIPDLTADDVGMCFPVILDCIFETGIYTYITAGDGTMTVAFM
jgi:hypothetical protein